MTLACIVCGVTTEVADDLSDYPRQWIPLADGVGHFCSEHCYVNWLRARSGMPPRERKTGDD